MRGRPFCSNPVEASQRVIARCVDRCFALFLRPKMAESTAICPPGVDPPVHYPEHHREVIRSTVSPSRQEGGHRVMVAIAFMQSVLDEVFSLVFPLKLIDQDYEPSHITACPG